MKPLKAIALVFIVISINISAMSPREIENRLREAFINFNLTDPIPKIITPKKSTALWTHKDNQCDLSPDATGDKDLCTFTAHWLAASIKNETVNRARTAFNAGAAGTFALLLPGLFLAEDNSLRAYAALTAVGLTAVNAPEKLAHWIRTICDRESFSLASAKLFEKEKYAELLSYFAHLQIFDHTPLSYDEKSLLMKAAASKKSALFCVLTMNRKTSPKSITASLQRQSKSLTPSKTIELTEEAFKNWDSGFFPLSLNSTKI